MLRLGLRLALALALAGCAAGKQLLVGGQDGWTRGRLYEDLQASVGDELVFQWTPGQHNVAELGSASCEGAADAAVLFELTADQPAVVALDRPGDRFFACSLPAHCDNGMLLAVHVSEPGAAEEAKNGTAAHKPSLEELIRPGRGRCELPAVDPVSGLHTVTCYSPPITLAPGQIEDALYYLPSPFPPDKTVGAVHHSSNVVEAGTGRLVPLSEVYLHHVFADGSYLVGEGAEHAGSKFHPELQEPFYTVIPAGKFEMQPRRLVNIHIISTLGVPGDRVLPCIECWCQNGTVTRAGKLGGGACCSSSHCQSTLPATELRTYEMQYTVKFRELHAGMPVSPIYSFMMDNVGGLIEFDVRPPEGEGQEPATWSTVSKTGPIDGRCPQTKPIRMLNCLGHLHIGGEQMTLIDSDTGEELCISNATYGKGSREEIGNESDYLVAMSMQARDEPVVIAPGTNVTMTALYRPEQHYGVMALMFLGLVDFDTSCPGSEGPALPGPQHWTPFGPDFANQKGTAFGFYNGEMMSSGSGDGAAKEALPDPAGIAAAAAPSSGARNGIILAGAVFGALLVGGAVVAAIVLARRRRALAYAKLHTESTQSFEF